MALTTVNSGGIKDDSIVNADIKSNAAIAKSKLASLDIVNADINASAAIALSKLASTPAVLTGSTNNTIATVTGANAIQGEANLTFDGTLLHVQGSTAEVRIQHSGNGGFSRLITDSNNNLNIYTGGGPSHAATIDSSGRLLTSGQTTSVADASNSHAHIQSHSADGNALSLGRYSANAYDPYITFFKSRNATIGSNGTIVQDGDTLGTINWYGATGSAWDHAAYHSVKVDGAPGASNDMPVEFTWHNQADGQQHPAHTMSLRANGNLEVKTGNLLIGTTTEGHGNGDDLTIGGSGARGLTIRSTDSGNCHIYMSDATSGTGQYDGYLAYVHSSQEWHMGSDATHRWTFKNNGDLVVNDGDLVIGTSGHGIDFSAQTGTSATGAATGSSPAELLDHYENGTWTPVADGSGTINGTSITYTGRYARIGQVVTVWFLASNSAGDIEIPSYKVFSGLPFAGGGWRSTGRVITEDTEILARQGDIAMTSGDTFILNKSGSSSGTVNLGGCLTYAIS